MDQMKKKIRLSKLQLGRIKNQIEKLVKQTLDPEMIAKFEVEVNRFRAQLELYQTEIEQLLMAADEKAADYEKLANDMMNDLQTWSEVGTSYEGKFKSFQKKLSIGSNRDSLLPSDLNQSSAAIPKLERIQVPSFNGDLLDFKNFKALFENLIHTSVDLSNVQKLFYLKQSLIGPAQEIIRDFELVDSAYPEAWAYLLSRYDNKKTVIRTLFNKLLNLEPIKSEVKIRSLLDQTDVIVRGLKANGEVIEQTFSKFVAHVVLSKLDVRTAREFENSLESSAEFPKWDTLQKFLQARSFVADNYLLSVKKLSPIVTQKVEKKSFTTMVNKSLKCAVCAQQHFVSQCDKFHAKSVKERFDIVKKEKLCLKCFSSDHGVIKCNRLNCPKCGGRHHQMLHREKSSQKSSSGEDLLSMDGTQVPLNTHANVAKTSFTGISTSNANKFIVLPTAVVSVIQPSKTGLSRRIKARVLLDNCSQGNLIVEKFVNRNKLATAKSIGVSIGGVTGNCTESKQSTNFVLKSRFGEFSLEVEADIVAHIPFSIASTPITKIIASNPMFNFAEKQLQHDHVDIVIGAEFYEAIVSNESSQCGTSFLRNSRLGWLISGPYVMQNEPNGMYCGLTTFEVGRQLEKFWHIEEASVENQANLEHESCNAHFEKTYTRNEKGRFIVRLPLKKDPHLIGESRKRAVSCLKRSEARSDPGIRAQYIDFMREYEQLDHMEKCSSQILFETSSSPVYYIPHQAVLRPESSTTKLRVVFNASAKSKSNVSLNDALMVGPTIQPQLFDILVRFRKHNVAFSADISKMYRQIIVHHEDRDLQRIVWREKDKEKIFDYRLKTVTYGTAPASFLATKCLSILSDELKDLDPAASRAMANDFCMDDLLTGSSSDWEAAKLQFSIHKKLKAAGMELRKYMSNSMDFLDTLDKNLIEKTKTVEFCESEIISLLGLQWHAVEDVFSIKYNFRDMSTTDITKRVILSEISRIYDPLGFLSPVVIKAKIMMQTTHNLNLDWDDPVPSQLREEFVDYYDDLSCLKSFTIRRRYSRFNSIASRSLIGFCDASEKAYSAVVYYRSVDHFGNVDSYIVCAKTRVAPKNEFKITIPKLELQGALLLAKLMNRISAELEIEEIVLFSDSSVVLHWLKGPVERWSVFVQNRLHKIVQLLPSRSWNYVPSNKNPADLATRGIKASAFSKLKVWITGPQFVIDALDPMLSSSVAEPTEIPEVRKVVLIVGKNDQQDFAKIISRYSDYTKLVNVLAYVLRFTDGCKRLSTSNNIALSVDEKSRSINCLIRILQSHHFQKEIAALSIGKRIPKSSSILKLSPFLDTNGILRATTRLNNSSLSYDVKNPVILYAKWYFVEIFISYIHKRYFHATRSFIINSIRSKYIVIGGIANAVKKVIRGCITCTRFRGSTCHQLMGQLPAARVTPSRPFTHVGVDFAGPFPVKCTGHRAIKFGKLYVAIFICFATRAVHLEIVSDLSSEAFLASMKRFSSRRGTPSDVYSDNATNFVGANRILNGETLQKFAYKQSINWHFNPPQAPHQGGIWEAAVKSAKYHMVRVNGGQVLTYEEYSTFFTEIEGIMNSRPLCYKPISSDTDSALTPAHFLIGEPVCTIPITERRADKSLRLSERFDLIRNQVQGFWAIWSKEYLNMLKSRQKWSSSAKNIAIGDVVLIKDEMARPYDWHIGRIERVHPDSQGQVRVVSVRSRNLVKKRCANKIVKLLDNL